MGVRLCSHRPFSSSYLPILLQRVLRLSVSSAMAMLTLTMVIMMMAVIPTRVVAVAGADGMSTARRGRESVVGTESGHQDIDEMRGGRRIQADPDPSAAILITNRTLLQGTRVVLTVTNAAGPSSGTIECFTWVRSVVFSSEKGLFFFMQDDSCWDTTTNSYVRGSRYLCKGDLRGIATSGDAQGKSSVLTLYWSSGGLNGTADSASTSLAWGAIANYWGFDLSRNEQYLVAPVDWGLGFVNTMDGSRTTFMIADFNCMFGALNPNGTILYVATGGCLERSAMDGESPGSFVNNFQTVACPSQPISGNPPSLAFGYRSFLQDGSYLYSIDRPNARILGFDLITGTMEVVSGTRIPYYVADNHNRVGIFNLRELALTQDGCNLFFVAYGATNVRWVTFDKPGGIVVREETVARCIVPGGCTIGWVTFDKPGGIVVREETVARCIVPGCNLFFVAYGATNVRWVTFDKPGGIVVREETVARCIVPGGCTIGWVTFDKPGGIVVREETVARCIVPGGCTIGTLALDNDDSHLYVSIQTGELFELPINKLGLHRCIGAFPTPVTPTQGSSAHDAHPSPSPSSSAAQSTQSSPSPSSSATSTASSSSPPSAPTDGSSAHPSPSPSLSASQFTESSPSPSTESSSSSSSSAQRSSPLPEPPTDLPAEGDTETQRSPSAGSSGSAAHTGNETIFLGRFSDIVSTPAPATPQTQPKKRVSVGLIVGLVVADCLTFAALAGAAVSLYFRPTKSSAMAGPGGMTARSSALEPPVAGTSAPQQVLDLLVPFPTVDDGRE
ncbi:hypothetical protein CBR_g78865 [Chara braunii]|uniref:Uncharacterized protein n=1 Tax=Chara braunii TaxID=69332 RepID=A0A388KAI2_CHABU|nr:hypothetical protein CBR_g78865 [Chara braunii]|eukprot:GBG67084.1 hypothetical protein CBR_g78865 [Chara braunii]